MRRLVTEFKSSNEADRGNVSRVPRNKSEMTINRTIHTQKRNFFLSLILLGDYSKVSESADTFVPGRHESTSLLSKLIINTGDGTIGAK